MIEELVTFIVLQIMANILGDISFLFLFFFFCNMGY